MIVLHILGILLKIIGILLLVLLGLVLLVLLLVLLCPVRYRGKGYKEGKDFGGILSVSWLWHLISLRFWYDSREGNPEYSIKLFGISLKKLLAFLEKRRDRKAEALKAKELSSPKTEGEITIQEKENEDGEGQAGKEKLAAAEKSETESTRTESSKAESSKAESSKTESSETVSPSSAQSESRQQSHKEEKGLWGVLRRIGDFWKSLFRLPGKLWKAMKNFKLTVEKICAKIGKIRDFLETQEFQRGRDLVFRESKTLLRKVLPRKMEGSIAFGTEDPCLTGEILAAVSIFYPLYGEHFTIEPYFDQKILEGWFSFKGRIRGIHFLLTAFRLLISSDIRYIIKHFKHH